MADVEIGPYTRFEVPPPLTVAFKDEPGNAINITGWAAQFHYRRVGGTTVVRDAVISDGPAGHATYTWVEADFETAGWYEGEMVVASVNQRLIQDPRPFWEVRESLVTTSPTIGP